MYTQHIFRKVAQKSTSLFWTKCTDILHSVLDIKIDLGIYFSVFSPFVVAVFHGR